MLSLVIRHVGRRNSKVLQGGRDRRISVRLLSGKSGHLGEGVDLTVEAGHSFEVQGSKGVCNDFLSRHVGFC